MMGRLACLVVLVAACGGGDEDDERRTLPLCERVRDRVVELRLADATNVDHDAHRTAMRAALGPEFIKRCEAEMSDVQIRCVLDAPDHSAVSGCSVAAR